MRGMRGDVVAGLAFVLLCCASVLLPTSLGAEKPIDAGGFLRRLAGSWEGRAVQTPVGPIPYHLDFRWVSGSCVSGTADTGNSRHTWKFCADGGKLAVTFLSDFAGNETPIRFEPAVRDGKNIRLTAKTHGFMKILMTEAGDERRIQVIHHGELHVEIALKRRGRADDG